MTLMRLALEPVKVTQAWQPIVPFPSATSFICKFFSVRGNMVPTSHMRTLFSAAVGFGSVAFTVMPAGIRTRTMTCCTGMLHTFRTAMV